MPSGVIGVPSSFEVGGVQYIAVQAGWGADARCMQNGTGTLTGKAKAAPLGGAPMVLKLEKYVGLWCVQSNLLQCNMPSSLLILSLFSINL